MRDVHVRRYRRHVASVPPYRRIMVGAKRITHIRYDENGDPTEKFDAIDVSSPIKVNGRQIGSYYVVLYPDGEFANIVNFDIDEEYRGKGLGLVTAKALVRELNHKGYRVRVDSEEETVGFWKKVGFYEAGQSQGGGVWMTEGGGY